MPHVDFEIMCWVVSLQETMTQEQKLRFIDLLDKLAPEKDLGELVKDYMPMKGR